MRITIEDALKTVLEGLVPLGVETVALPDAAGRVLARDVLGDRDQPPFNRAAMDGYAIRSQDTAGAPVRLRVVDEVPAGASSDHVLQSGEAIRIMTGAPVPDSADSVQMVEKTRRDGDEHVIINEGTRPRQHIAARGQDLRQGALAVPAGSLLTTARMGVCWALGAAEVPVYRRPRVAVLTTGDELVELHQTPGPTQIRDSNRCTITSIARRAGAEIVRSEIVRDDKAATRAAIRSALGEADVLVLSGGVSAGDYDFVAEALQAEGVAQVFHKVEMKPGKPLWYGRRAGQPVFGLPGNPVSSLVTARIFMAPALRALGGRAAVCEPMLTLPLLEGFRGTGSRPTFQPARIDWQGGGVRLVKTHGSGDLTHFATMTALAFLPPDRPPFQVGDLLRVYVDDEALFG